MWIGSLRTFTTEIFHSNIGRLLNINKDENTIPHLESRLEMLFYTDALRLDVTEIPPAHNDIHETKKILINTKLTSAERFPIFFELTSFHKMVLSNITTVVIR